MESFSFVVIHVVKLNWFVFDVARVNKLSVKLDKNSFSKLVNVFRLTFLEALCLKEGLISVICNVKI